MAELRVGLIGLGRIADLHVLGYLDNPRARVAAVCDADPATAERRAREWNVERSSTDYRELLADPSLDALEVLTPHHLHAAMTVQALEAGKHVSVQKPVAMTLAEADSMIEAAERTGRVLRVFENFRFYPPYVRAKELLDAGEIGDPLSIRVKVIDGRSDQAWNIPASAWAWRIRDETCGGGPCVFDHGYHIFSLVMYFLGPVSRVFAWIDRTEFFPGVVVDTPSLIAWRHVAGDRMGYWETVTAPLMEVRSRYYANDEWLEITGSRGVIWVNRCSGMMLEGPALVVYRDGRTTAHHDLETDWASSFIASTRDFIDGLLDGRQPEVSPGEAREILRFSLAAHRSAAEGREVRLEELA